MHCMTAAGNVHARASAHPTGGATASGPSSAVSNTAMPGAAAPGMAGGTSQPGPHVPNHHVQGHHAPVIPHVALRLQRRTFAKGEYLYDVGHEARCAFIVEAGLVALTLGAVADRQRVIALAGPGDVIGAITPNLGEHRCGAVALSAEVAARVLPSGARATSATSSTSTTSSTGPATADCSAQDPDPAFTELLASAAGEQIQRLTWALEDSAHPVPARVARTLLRLGQRFGHHTGNGTVRLTLPVTHDTLASLVGAARETTTYTIQQLRQKGLLSGTRGSYHFEPGALARFADDAALAGR